MKRSCKRALSYDSVRTSAVQKSVQKSSFWRPCEREQSECHSRLSYRTSCALPQLFRVHISDPVSCPTVWLHVGVGNMRRRDKEKDCRTQDTKRKQDARSSKSNDSVCGVERCKTCRTRTCVHICECISLHSSSSYSRCLFHGMFHGLFAMCTE